MCGIFGLMVHQDAGYEPVFIKKSLSTLARLSESRGKDSSGFVFRSESEKQMQVFKGSVTLNYLLKRQEVKDQIDKMIGTSQHNSSGGRKSTFAVMGHSRLVTNGSQINDANNQPVVKDGIVGIHNGIIVNENELWSLHSDLQRSCEIDTEVMLALIRKYIQSDKDVTTAVSKTVNEIFGTVAAAFFPDDLNVLFIATNNGSLYTLTNKHGLFIFASEEYYLRQLANTMHLDTNNDVTIQQVMPGQGLVLDLDNFQLQKFSFDSDTKKPRAHSNMVPYRIAVKLISNGKPQRELILDPARIAAHPRALKESSLLEYNIERINTLRRCSKCLLPETFPFIEYDECGVCNYCNNYKIKNAPKPIEELIELVKPYRRY